MLSFSTGCVPAIFFNFGHVLHCKDLLVVNLFHAWHRPRRDGIARNIVLHFSQCDWTAKGTDGSSLLKTLSSDFASALGVICVFSNIVLLTSWKWIVKYEMHIYSLYSIIYIYIYVCVYIYICMYPVVRHKAVAEVSKIGHYRRGELLWCMGGRANPLMDRKVVGVVFLEWLQWLQRSPHPQLLDVVWWSAAVVVVVV